MLIEQITNPQIRFAIVKGKLGKAEKASLAKQAFLYIIEKYDACEFQKEKMFREIVEACPEIMESISDEEMKDSFQLFYENATKSGKIVSTEELKWIGKYVRDNQIRIMMERMIYHKFLRASSHWDKERREFKWSISKKEKAVLASEIICHFWPGNKRAMELAQEFGLPYIEDYRRGYFRKLLYDRHYDKAAELGVADEDTIIGVILSNIDNRYLHDALDVARRFLPDRNDVIEEIEQIVAAFK